MTLYVAMDQVKAHSHLDQSDHPIEHSFSLIHPERCMMCTKIKITPTVSRHMIWTVYT